MIADRRQKKNQEEMKAQADRQRRERMEARQTQKARRERVEARRVSMAGRSGSRKAGTVSGDGGYRATIGMDGTIG